MLQTRKTGRTVSMPAKNVLILSAAVLALGGCARQTRTESGPAGEAASGEPSAAVVMLNREHLSPGASAELGILISLASGWHTYADPPGDSGMAPHLSLQLPPGFRAGAKRLPPYRIFKDAAGTTHGYEHHLLIRVPLEIDSDAAVGTTPEASVQLEYLICKEICVPRTLEAVIKIPIRAESAPLQPQWSNALRQGGWSDATD
jgi:DsbC/DsbD-like thiol-disulfide interchange protein